MVSYPLAASANYKGRVHSIASPVLCGTRLAFEWNEGALDSLVDAFIEFNPKRPEPPDEEEKRPLPKNHDHQHDKSWDREPNKDPVVQTRDYLAFYAPASTNSSERYGIHFRVGRICHLALDWSRKLPNGKAENTIDKEVLEALIVMIFWHEVGHGWIEDIASTIDPSRYRDTQIDYAGYIYREEAICNTIALRMLRFYRREQAGADSLIIEKIKDLMLSQGEGYKDFEDLGSWGQQQPLLEEKIVELLFKDYGCDPAAARNATTEFFAHHTPVPWMTHHRKPPKNPIPPYMNNWRHPLHAEKIPGAKHTGKKLGQPLTPLLAAVLKSSGHGGKHPPKEVKNVLLKDRSAIFAWDFIGPDAAARIDESLVDDGCRQARESSCIPRPVDCYGRSSMIQNRIEKKKVRDKIKSLDLKL